MNLLKVKDSWMDGVTAADGVINLRKIVRMQILNSWTSYVNTNKTITLKGCFSGPNGAVQSQYEFDLVAAKKPRHMWLHKNQSTTNGSEQTDRIPCT